MFSKTRARITEGEFGSLSSEIICVQLTAPEGFSIHPADPHFTPYRVRLQPEMNLLVSINTFHSDFITIRNCIPTIIVISNY